ncbi:glycosyltransferase family 2 protein [Persicobacter sp. CCB-QB2]|uniref:glycosyltransferase family 2 protein n=1 Tax=Persicobacter sp. CCB-QB2 TaxID=1561025 RepID=UPI0006A99B9C|nr:glycosyltransferase family 2 protein [Persicobacter sp. CCB-QB2]
MLDISVIILTYNEEKHIERCINNVKGWVKEVFIVDSFSSDKTVALAQKMGAQVFQNKWEKNYAKQFNWGLANLPITGEWVLRLDADEYLLPELVAELQDRLPNIESRVSGITFKRRHIFMGDWVKQGVYPVKLCRLFRKGKGVCEQRWMDEHIVLKSGTDLEFEHDFVDHNLNNLSWWIGKHNGYAIREAIDLLDMEYGLISKETVPQDLELNRQADSKRSKKYKYMRQPLFGRALAYFIYRYFFKMGFRDGKAGFMWHFFQGWWYRTLVDAQIFEIKQKCGGDTTAIKQYIAKEYQIQL